MHARHRNGPGNGYRSNVIGMDIASASRIPPDSTMRGLRMYSPDHRNYSRGGYTSGGHSKQFQLPVPPPPPRAPDMFLEAGKLAAEYLVSKGVLPPSALSGKLPYDGLKNATNFQSFRPHEVLRGSVHSRLGNVCPDVGPGRRRYSEESSLIGSSGSVRERKRNGAVKRYVPDVNRESGRSNNMSRPQKVCTSQGVDDASVGHRDERPTEKRSKGGTHNLSSSEVTQELVGEALGSGLESSHISGDANTNEGNCSHSHSADGEQPKNHDDTDKFNKEIGVNDAKEVTNGVNSQQEHGGSEVVKGEDDMVSEDYIDLVKHSKFVNVPTRARSSLAGKNAKGDQEASMNNDDNAHKRDFPEGSGVHVIDTDIHSSASDDAPCQIIEFKSNESDIDGNLDVTERPIYKEPEADEGLSDFGRSNSVLAEVGVKRAIEFSSEAMEGVKKIRHWVPVLDNQSNGSKPLSSSLENCSLLQEPKTSQSAPSTQPQDLKGHNFTVFQKNKADSCEFLEEKRLFPKSFKTCDLNLVGNGDVGESHTAGRMIIFPSLMQSRKEAMPIDVDYSINKNGNVPSKNAKNASLDSEMEVIDLEKDSAQEGKTLRNPDGSGDVFSELDGFPNTANNGNRITDGYGLMISELLRHDGPNCSAPTDLNLLHNHMDLHTTEGILEDDDSIYMSLGEIPISLLGPWEQPTQDYGKPF